MKPPGRRHDRTDPRLQLHRVRPPGATLAPARGRAAPTGRQPRDDLRRHHRRCLMQQRRWRIRRPAQPWWITRPRATAAGPSAERAGHQCARFLCWAVATSGRGFPPRQLSIRCWGPGWHDLPAPPVPRRRLRWQGRAGRVSSGGLAGGQVLGRSGSPRGLLRAGGRGRASPDDREAPVVEADQFGEDFGAHSAAIAGDGVNPQFQAGCHRCRRGGTGSTGAFALPQHHPCACWSSSAAKTVSALLMSRTAPSGWLQAPRPFTWASQRRNIARLDVRPSASRWASPATASRPNRHGPHWPADSSAR